MSKTVLIIGASSGIGAATASRLNNEDINLITPTRFEFDVTNSSATLSLPDQIDGIVYCPGTINLKPYNRLTEEDFLSDLQVNLLGANRVIQQALPALKKSPTASIVLFSTIAVQMGMPFHASIAAAKGAVEGLARSLAAELAPKIRVNVIAPSLTDTRLASQLLADDKRREAAAERHPLKQIGKPEQIAEQVAYLLSDAANFTTGQILRPDGGLSSVRLF
ncbi:SDR family oxidoreductase [Akkermansiaceae bacterium]|nr:SDR family oxidoreductase [Akkermansiaceae bacterium]MDB4500838.1 SDR family oxidoreductase [Akkermansiaceae bacterium]